MQKTMNFTLTNPVEISVNGEFDKVYELTLVAPSFNDRKHAGRLCQMLTTAETETASKFLSMMSEDLIEKAKEEAGKSEGTEEETKSNMKEVIMGSSIDIEEFYNACECLFENVCYVADDVKIKKQRFKEMSFEDFQNLCFEYLAFFIKPL